MAIYAALRSNYLITNPMFVGVTELGTQSYRGRP